MNILFTSVGRRSYLLEYFKDAVGDGGKIHAANSTPVTPAFKAADKTVVTPLIYDKTYVDFIIDYCLENEIDAVISLFDADLPVLAANKKLFEGKGIKLIISDEDTIKICNDKWRAYEYFTKNHILTPKTYISLFEAVKACKDGVISYPLMVKPRWGMGSIAIYEARGEDELNVLYKKAADGVQSSYLKYESSENYNECVLIQEKVLGEEYGLDIINDLNKNYKNTIVKKKLSMRAGETDCAITVENALLSELGRRLSCIMRHIGNLDTDIIWSKDNKAYVLEMNARFGGGYPFSHAAGADLPLAIVKWLSGELADDALFEAKPQILAHKDIKIAIL